MVLQITIQQSTRLEGVKVMIKLKDLITEHAWKRKFGEPLPTLETSTEKHKAKKVNEGGMGILTSDQADVLQAIVMRNKNKNLKALLKIVLKDSMFKRVDKKELLGYIDGARQFVKYMKSHPMESVNEGISQGDIKVIDTHDIPSFKEPKHSYELVYVIKPKVIKVGGETKSTVRFLVKGKYGGRIVDIPIDALKKSNKFEKYKVRFKGDILPKFKRFIKGDKVLESINEGFTKYHIRLTKTPGWYGVWDKNGKQKFEGDRKYVTKHLKKLKTRMGNFQLKSLIDVATKRKGKDIEFDVVESVISERNPDAELYKKLGKIGTDIGTIVKKYEKMADTDKALSTFMVGLHSMLVKMGYKRFK